jgi:hypothetical protein
MTSIAWSSENALRAFPRTSDEYGCGLFLEPARTIARAYFYAERFKSNVSSPS